MKPLSFVLILLTSSLSSSFGQPVRIDPLVAHIDSTVRPGDDFFLFANGRWFKENPIPPSEQSNGIFLIVQDTINAQIRTLCESSAREVHAPAGSDKQKIGDFFFSGMDSVLLNSKGLADLRGDLGAIDAMHDFRDVVKEAAYIHSVAGAPLFNFGVGQDDRISEKNAVFFEQGGLSLPDRRFYFDEDEQAQTIRRKFVEHVANMLGILGYDSSDARSGAVRMMELETSLAKFARKREDTRDPIKNYNKMTLRHFVEITPDLSVPAFLELSGLRNVDTVIIGQPEYFTSLNGLCRSIPLESWKVYLKYHLVRGLSRFLDDATYGEVFRFYGTVLRGVPEPKPRWKRVVEETDALLGELVGKVYVREYLPPGTKEKLLEIGNAVKSVYAERIKRLKWMSEKTKVRAEQKLASIIMKVGYPDKWKDLSSLTVARTSFVENGKSANRWRFNYMISKFGKPVDRTEWGMEPQTYNAYYNPSNNEIVVPGCNIIVPGYERVLADDALLYSIIGGSTFGHEMTHGFDDQGSKYNAEGNLDNWWTSEDSARFVELTKGVVRQFDGYVAVDSLHINGELTQGENIADIGGVMMGFEAFKKTRQYRSRQIIGGLTPEQRYFLGYALGWMMNYRPEAVASQVRSDEHSPAKFRVIGPVTDMPEFFEAFGIKPGDPMWRPDSARAGIW
ncbi:MAG TPA: M13 family metallopeptidase [Bacteroidota bacterium]|nr:M13 family metallopeptidase [Bacteroidota bacterium]